MSLNSRTFCHLRNGHNEFQLASAAAAPAAAAVLADEAGVADEAAAQQEDAAETVHGERHRRQRNLHAHSLHGNNSN